jgi:hypothetical protein
MSRNVNKLPPYHECTDEQQEEWCRAYEFNYATPYGLLNFFRRKYADLLEYLEERRQLKFEDKFIKQLRLLKYQNNELKDYRGREKEQKVE